MKTVPFCISILAVCALQRATASAAGTGAAAAVIALSPALVNQLAEEMRRNNPALQAAESRARSASLGAEAVRVWEDPMVMIGGQVADKEMRADEGDLIYGVEQKLPLFGKPKAARKAAEAEASAEQAAAEYQFQVLRRDLARALFKTALADRVVEVGEVDRAWLETMLATTDARFHAGQASLVQVVQLQNELARRTNQLRTDVLLRDTARGILNRFLSRDAQSPWPRLELPGVAIAVPFSPRLVELGLRYEPQSRLLREQARQSEAMLEVSRRARYPDVALDLEGRNYTGNGDFRQGMFFLKFSLPLGNASKYRRDIQREEQRLRAARWDVVDQELAVRLEIQQLTAAIDAARREALLYRDEIIPRSEQARASAQAEWETGRGMFRDVLEAHRMLLESRLMTDRAVAEQWQMLSELVLCCGLGDLEALWLLNSAIRDGAPEPTKRTTTP